MFKYGNLLNGKAGIVASNDKNITIKFNYLFVKR